jgi:hypothetical protein
VFLLDLIDMALKFFHDLVVRNLSLGYHIRGQNVAAISLALYFLRLHGHLQERMGLLEKGSGVGVDLE